MTCGGNLQEKQNENYKVIIFSLWSWDLGSGREGVTPQNEIRGRRETILNSYLNLPLWFQNGVWNPPPSSYDFGIGCDPLPFRLMGSMILLRGGVTPQNEITGWRKTTLTSCLNLPLRFRNGVWVTVSMYGCDPLPLRLMGSMTLIGEGGVTPQNENRGWRKTTWNSYRSESPFTILEWSVTPIPLRLMGSMTLLGEGGHTPKWK